MTRNFFKTYLTTKEVAELLDVNEKIVYQLITEKGLPATKITGKWLFPRHLVQEWLESHVINHPGTSVKFQKNLLIIVGSNDLLLERTINLFNKLYPESPAVFGLIGSFGGLKILKERHCHIAGAHLLESNEKEYNFAYLKEYLNEPLPAVINFCFREQGLLLAPGNPKGINSIKDLARKDVILANRPCGTGTRLLLDHELQKAGIKPEQVKGYKNEFPSHLDVGIEVLSGRADVGIGIKAVASLLGLEFIPLRRERYDLFIPRDVFFEEHVQRFLSLLQEKRFYRLAEELSDYDVSQAGKMIFPKSHKKGGSL